MGKLVASEVEIYKDFFTSGAVAWFSAGVIGPLFSDRLGVKEVIASLVSVAASLVFVRLAVKFGVEEK